MEVRQAWFGQAEMYWSIESFKESIVYKSEYYWVFGKMRSLKPKFTKQTNFFHVQELWGITCCILCVLLLYTFLY